MKPVDLQKLFGIRVAGGRGFNDNSLRILAVLLAVGLWIFVNAGERGAVDELTVPVSYRTLPRGMVIMNHPPDFVKIEVEGTRTILSLLEPEQLALKLDLAGVTPGRSEFKIYPAMFNTKRGATVTRISPDLVTLDVDRLVSREVPVRLALREKVAPGFAVSGIELTPPAVSVTGPSRFVSQLSDVSTDPFDVKGLTTDTEGPVDLAEPNPEVRYSVARVDARVHVTELIADREFRAVEVEVKDPDFKYRVDPKQATLTIRGPAAKLAGLEAKGLAFVDAKGVEPGSHELPLQVTLPDGMQLVRQSPDKVRLRMYREKRTTNATADEHPS
ncbi:MAG TPA: CdaR family protein [Candidatus Acidoferrales bacterium]|nr:CdaR family protein [Candidatus Acidoferrales bacterium]